LPHAFCKLNQKLGNQTHHKTVTTNNIRSNAFAGSARARSKIFPIGDATIPDDISFPFARHKNIQDPGFFTCAKRARSTALKDELARLLSGRAGL
jgi:hypothetical protein